MVTDTHTLTHALNHTSGTYVQSSHGDQQEVCRRVISLLTTSLHFPPLYYLPLSLMG